MVAGYVSNFLTLPFFRPAKVPFRDTAYKYITVYRIWAAALCISSIISTLFTVQTFHPARVLYLRRASICTSVLIDIAIFDTPEVIINIYQAGARQTYENKPLYQ